MADPQQQQQQQQKQQQQQQQQQQQAHQQQQQQEQPVPAASAPHATPATTAPHGTNAPPTSTAPAPSSPLPTKPKRRRLTAVQKIQIQTLRRIGWTYARISSELGVTQRGVQVACTPRRAPPKTQGRPSVLGPEARARVLEFVGGVGKGASAVRVKRDLGLECSVDAVRRFLRAEGVGRGRDGRRGKGNVVAGKGKAKEGNVLG